MKEKRRKEGDELEETKKMILKTEMKRTEMKRRR
jgi:hypothetical protein